MNTLPSHLRVAFVTLVVCTLGYTLGVAAFARIISPARAVGSLVHDASGQVVGSRLVGQAFSSPHYVWPRLSAVDYNAAGAGGSNLSPTNPALVERARPVLAALGAVADRPVPADLVTASGSGLDPDVTLAGALYQAARIAQARGVDTAAVRALIESHAESIAGPFDPGRKVNVLEVNLALDAEFPSESPRS
jgi:K+-transporting ATPase ATPase C chain